MPKVTEEYRDARRQEIADAALRVFRRRGFQAASMAEIITESGMSAGAIYGHFRSREEIVHDVAGRVIGARIADVEQLATLDPMPAPRTVVRTMIAGLEREVGDLGAIVQLWGEAITDPAIRELAAGIYRRMSTVMAGYLATWHEQVQGRTPEQAATLARAQVPLFVAAIQSYTLTGALVDDFDREAYLTAIEAHLPG